MLRQALREGDVPEVTVEQKVVRVVTGESDEQLAVLGTATAPKAVLHFDERLQAARSGTDKGVVLAMRLDGAVVTVEATLPRVVQISPREGVTPFMLMPNSITAAPDGAVVGTRLAAGQVLTRRAQWQPTGSLPKAARRR